MTLGNNIIGVVWSTVCHHHHRARQHIHSSPFSGLKQAPGSIKCVVRAGWVEKNLPQYTDILHQYLLMLQTTKLGKDVQYCSGNES